MSGIARLSEKMKKKISLGDYGITPIVSEPEPEKPAQPTGPEGRKIYTLAKDDMYMLKAIFAKRLHSSNESSIAQIMSEAIHLLYKNERF